MPLAPDAVLCLLLVVDDEQAGKQTGCEQHVSVTHLEPDGQLLLEVHRLSELHAWPDTAQKPLPSAVFRQKQLGLFPHAKGDADVAPHLNAQWHCPLSSGAPPLLRHLRRWRAVRASALSAKPMLESVAPSTLYPAHFIAWRLEMSFSASHLASSSRSSNTSSLPFV